MAKFIVVLGNESAFLPTLRACKEREMEHWLMVYHISFPINVFMGQGMGLGGAHEHNP